MSASDYREMPSDWKEQLLNNPSSLTLATTQPCNDAFKTYMYYSHQLVLFFFSHFGHPNIAIKSSLGVSDLGTTRVKGICQIRAFLNSCASPALDPFCSPVWREEETGAAFKHLSSLLLPKWRRGWDRPMAGISKDCSHSFSAPLPDQPDLTLKTEASEQVNTCKKCQQNLILLIQNSS